MYNNVPLSKQETIVLHCQCKHKQTKYDYKFLVPFYDM